MRKELLEMIDVGLGLIVELLGSAARSAVEVPRSAPEPELGTAETMDHFHKIVLEVLLVDEV